MAATPAPANRSTTFGNSLLDVLAEYVMGTVLLSFPEDAEAARLVLANHFALYIVSGNGVVAGRVLTGCRNVLALVAAGAPVWCFSSAG